MSDFVFGHLADLAARALRRVQEIRGDGDERPPFPEASYAEWLQRYDAPAPADRAVLERWLADIAEPALVSLLCPLAAGDDRALTDMVHSLQQQTYARWELIVVTSPSVVTDLRDADGDGRVRYVAARDGAPAGPADLALGHATGEWVGLIEGSDRVSPHALAFLIHAVSTRPDTALVYSDEDEIDEADRRHSPRFKPDINVELLRSSSYLGRLSLFRTSLVRQLGGFAPEPGAARELDLALRVLDSAGETAIHHVPRVLYHTRRRVTDATADAAEARGAVDALGAIERHLQRRQMAATVTIASEFAGARRVEYVPPDPPLQATVIIPTRNNPALLQRCVDSLLTRTAYSTFEIFIVDNGSDDGAALAYLRSLETIPNVRIRQDGRPFNWAALNNAAVRSANSPLLCFLNDDVEALTPGWLTEMATLAARREVGVVGARLWYPDDTMQHAGLVLHPATGASHVCKRLPRGKAGYLGRAVLRQDVSAVTGACLVVRREVFDEVSGFDEAFAVDFNDVDFCLRVRARGYRNIWTPFAELRHHEAASRGPWEAPGNRERFERAKEVFLERWGVLASADPAFNPNLALTNAEPPLAWPPRQEAIG